MKDEREKGFEIGRIPDYKVSALDKRTELKGRIGGAWLNPNKSISIVIDPFIQLNQDGNLVITLFPIDKK